MEQGRVRQRHKHTPHLIAHSPIPKTQVGYYQPLTQWSKGEYANATNKENDLVVMQKHLPLRPDDWPSTRAAAAPLNATRAAAAGRSVAVAYCNIERSGDADWVKFEAGAGAAVLTISLTPGGRSNADLSLEIWAEGGAAPLAAFNPEGLLSGAQAVTLPAAGNYRCAFAGLRARTLRCGLRGQALLQRCHCHSTSHRRSAEYARFAFL